MSRRSAVIAAPFVMSLLVLASCSSDGNLTRPTLPGRSTVPSSEPTATPAPTEPATQPPATDAPTTPSTVPPTEPPVTDPGATAPPTDAPTVTDAPTTTPATVPPTEPPATVPPTTETAPTEPATTEAATTTPVTEPIATVPEPEAEGGDDSDADGTTWWPWLVLALLIIIGGIVWAIRRRGPAWPERVATLLDELDTTTAHLSAHTAEGLRVVAQAEATSLAGLRARLRELVTSAPEEHRALLDALTQPLGDLHTAVASVALAPGSPSPDDHQAVVRAAALVHATSATARVSIVPPPPAPAR